MKLTTLEYSEPDGSRTAHYSTALLTSFLDGFPFTKIERGIPYFSIVVNYELRLWLIFFAGFC